MPAWVVRLLEQWASVRAAPLPFGIAVVFAAAAIWVAIGWSYSGVLASKNAQIELQDRQLADLREALAGRGPSQKNIVDVTSDFYRAQATDDVLNVTSLPAKIILPTNFLRGKTIIVKDGTGLANQNNILISVDGGALISGLSVVAITSARGSWSFIWDGKEWSMYYAICRRAYNHAADSFLIQRHASPSV